MSHARVHPRRAVALALAASVLWPLQEYAGGILIREHHAAQVVALRYVTHLLLLLAWVLPRYGVRGLTTQRPALQILRGLCMFGMPASWILASRFAAQPWVWTIFWLLPVLVLAGGYVIAERPPAAAWLAAIIGAAGAAAFWRTTPGSMLGAAFALCMSGSFAGYLVLSRVLRDETLGASLFFTGIGALLPLTLVLWRVWSPLTGADLLPAVVTGGISILILACFDLSLEAGPLWVVAPLLTLVPAWELGLAVPLHGRAVGISDMAGIVLVLAAAIIAAAGSVRGHSRRLAAAGSAPDRQAPPQSNFDPQPTTGAGRV